MTDWLYQQLGELFEIQLGKMLSAASKFGTQYPYLANRNVQWGRIVIDDLGTMNFSEAQRERYRLAPGDLLVCEGGEVGRAAMWSGELDECYFQNAIHRLRPRLAVSALFMRHYFEFAATQGSLRALTGQTSIGHLPRARLVRWMVPVPSLKEQQEIAEALDTVDETIRTAERSIAKLCALMQGLIAEAVECALRTGRPLSLGEIADDSPASLIQTGPFGSQLQANEYIDDGVPVFMPTDIRGSHLDVDGAAKISKDKAAQLGRHQLQVGDLLLSRRGDLSRCAVVTPLSSSGICGTGCLLIRVRAEDLPPDWLAMAYRHEFVQRQVLAQAVGSTMPNLSASLVRSLEVPRLTRSSRHLMPSIQAAARQIETDRTLLRKLHALRAGLASDLLSGRVRTVAA